MSYTSTILKAHISKPASSGANSWLGHSRTQERRTWYIKASEVEGTTGHVTEEFIKKYNEEHNNQIYYKDKKFPFTPRPRMEMY